MSINPSSQFYDTEHVKLHLQYQIFVVIITATAGQIQTFKKEVWNQLPIVARVHNKYSYYVLLIVVIFLSK